MGQRGEVAGQQVNGKGQRSCGIDNRHNNMVIQQEAAAKGVLQPLVAVRKHQIDGNHNVVDVDEQACHEAGVQELLTRKLESRQAVGGRQGHHQEDGQRHHRNDNGVQHIAAHVGLVPGIGKVLPVQMGGQCPGVAVAYGSVYSA